jgi:hypothetical protein
MEFQGYKLKNDTFGRSIRAEDNKSTYFNCLKIGPTF